MSWLIHAILIYGATVFGLWALLKYLSIKEGDRVVMLDEFKS